MADPVEDIIGDYRAFVAQQRDRLATRGIDITPYPLSHLAYRVPEWDQYVHVRGLLERHAIANPENVWNGRPMSLILLEQPLEVLGGAFVPLELAYPVSQLEDVLSDCEPIVVLTKEAHAGRLPGWQESLSRR